MVAKKYLRQNEGGDGMVRSLAQVGITCTDIEKSLKFYHGILGLPLLEAIDVPEDQVRDIYGLSDGTKVTLFLLRTGNGGFVELFRFEPLGGPRQTVVWNRPGITHLALDVKNLPEVMRRLKEAGLEFVCPVKCNLGTDFVFTRDPDGNLVELIDMKKLYWPGRLLGGVLAKLNMKSKYKDLYGQIRGGGKFPPK
jgi:catechol 2,3-dioxygenase-like lactoylglutathione lyase family enzyme